MRPPTTTQLSRMQDANEAAMWDTCRLVTRVTGAVDDYGQPTEMWAEGVAVACGLDQRSSYEVLRGTQVWRFDARLRLPIATELTNADRIKVTHRYGVALTVPLVFEVIGAVRRGPQGLLVEMKTLSDGSVT
jgi:head-tail adaptor